METKLTKIYVKRYVVHVVRHYYIFETINANGTLSVCYAYHAYRKGEEKMQPKFINHQLNWNNEISNYWGKVH